MRALPTWPNASPDWAERLAASGILSGSMGTGTAQVVILGAGRSVRGASPSAMVDIAERGRVLDWLLDAFAVLDAAEVAFVAGFRAEDVVDRYPQLRVVINRAWAETGPVESLGLVALDPLRDAFVCYSDIVFRRRAVEALTSAPVGAAIAVDTRWRGRYDGRSPRDLERAEKVRIANGQVTAIGAAVPVEDADAEFAGVLRLSPHAVAAALRALARGSLAPTATLPELVEEIRAAGVEVHAVDLMGDWAELDAQQDLARFVLGTKAESLERLRPMDHGALIDPSVSFTRSQWSEDASRWLDRVERELTAGPLIVRSSALSEDSWSASAAGAHESIAAVEPEPAAVRRAIDTVFASYRRPEAGDQVLLQNMVRDVAMSGVVMTRTHALGAPYYVVEFDESADRTDVVTGGGAARSIVCLRGAELGAGLPAGIAPVLSAAQKIEGLVGHDSLDIEFAVTRGDGVHILQVRPIAVAERPIPIEDDAVTQAALRVREFVAARSGPVASLLGSTTRWSVMTDWNPAEIIGTTPGALAVSLYRALVTDSVWARQRAEYGYRDVRPHPLLNELAGHPYVDVRVCFNSFVPAALSDELAARLVDHQLATLAAQPALHDKVEFAVLHTCLDPTFPERAGELRAAGFSDADVDALHTVLRAITAAGIARLGADLADLDALEHEIAAVTRVGAPIVVAAELLDLVRERGTLVFAHLARAAFVATALVRGLVATGRLEPARVEEFLASAETVFGRLQVDAAAVRGDALAWEQFVARYGHLRPGTYDITSTTYAAAADAYLRPLVDHAIPVRPVSNFEWTPTERAAIGDALDALGLAVAVDEFDRFVRDAIAGREAGKFVFTKALSDAIELLAAAGADLGFTREELAHVRIDEFLRLRDALDDPTAFVARRVAEGTEAHHVALAVALPGQIAGPMDALCFEQPAAEPNFVGRHVVEAPVLVSPGADEDVAGTIVLIPSADPGFDWLLARDIVGLVTMFGGANSHMAVRAAECGLAAAVGVGETRFAVLAGAAVIRLDGDARAVTVVR